MIKTLLFEDTEIDKRGIISLLRQIPDIDFIDSYDSLNVALKAVSEFKPDLIIADSEIYGDKQLGQEFVNKARKILPNVKILGLTRYSECLKPLLKAGCDGVALKTFIYDEKVASKYIRETILSQGANDKYLPPPKLNCLEDKVLRQIANGFSEQKISINLSINRYNVRKVKSSLKDKFGATTDTELVTNAFRYGYLKPSDDF